MMVEGIVKAVLPIEARRWMRRQQQRLKLWPRPGWVRFGSLRRVTPISRVFGFDRGLCIDRYYIESFLQYYDDDVRGLVLEIGEDTYARKFGGDRLTAIDVLHAVDGNPKATIVDDLASANNIESDRFDCIIATQTLQFIYDTRAAIKSLHRILKPGGVLLATVPGISQVSRYDADRWGDYWRFTTQSAQRLFQEVFPSAALTVKAHGNVMTAVGFLHGLAVEDMGRKELDHADRDYELLITVRAQKPEVNHEDSRH